LNFIQLFLAFWNVKCNGWVLKIRNNLFKLTWEALMQSVGCHATSISFSEGLQAVNECPRRRAARLAFLSIKFLLKNYDGVLVMFLWDALLVKYFHNYSNSRWIFGKLMELFHSCFRLKKFWFSVLENRENLVRWK